ncbi:MAG: phage tail tape measure protein [Proteobacteria bacterium]|nr:phage tail tape measure protein [Pseudomonadota bacterium]
MSKQHTVAVTIGAALKGSFGSTLSKGGSQITKLGSAIKKLDGDSKRITSFRTLKTQVQSAKSAWDSAEEQVKQLSTAMRNTKNPTQTMQREFEKAKNASNRTKTAYIKQRDSLQKVRGEMAKTGQSTRNLTSQQTKLGASVIKLQSRYRALDSTLKRSEAIKARRSAIRGQLFDMVALGIAIGAPLKAAIDFESVMADVRKVVDFKDKVSGLRNFGNIIKQISRDIPISAEGLAQIAAAGGTLGISETELPDFVDVVAKMSTAFDLLPEEAGDAIAKLSNIFGVPINEMTKLGDAINFLSDNTAAKARDIIPVLARVGAQAQDFGLSAEQTAALADSFIALGKPPQIAATAINAMLLRLNTADKQSAKFQRGLSELGVEATELKKSIKNDAQGALLSFLQTVSKVEKQQRAGILSDLFGLEFSDDVSLLAGNVNQYKKALDLLGNAKRQNSMQREFANRATTLANRLQLLKNSITEIGINIGETIIPPLKVVVDGIRSFTSGIADFVTKIPLLSGVVFGVTFSLIGLKIAFVALNFLWTFVTGGAALVRIGLAKLGVEIALTGIKFQAFNKIALITAIKTKALAVATFVSGTWTNLGLAATFVKTRFLAFNLVSAITFVRMKALAIGQSIMALFGVLGGAVSLATTKLTTFNIVSLITAGRIRLLAFGGAIKAFAGGLIALASRAIPLVIGGLRALTIAFLTNPIGLIIGGISIAAGLLIANWGKVKGFFGGLWEPIQSVWQTFADWVGGFWKIISSPLTAIGRVFGILFGSGNKVQANITSTTKSSTPSDFNSDNATTQESTNLQKLGDNTIPQKTASLQESIVGGIITNQRSVDSRTITNNFKIDVHTTPGQDEESIAEKVMRQIKDASRGALFDTAGATL